MRGGAYFDLSVGQLVLQRFDGETLPGGNERKYLKVSLPLAMVIGLVSSLAYVIFLPFIGMALVIGYSTLRGVKALGRMTESILPVALPHWVPGEAYFARLISSRKKEAEEREEEEEKGAD